MGRSFKHIPSSTFSLTLLRWDAFRVEYPAEYEKLPYEISEVEASIVGHGPEHWLGDGWIVCSCQARTIWPGRYCTNCGKLTFPESNNCCHCNGLIREGVGFMVCGNCGSRVCEICCDAIGRSCQNIRKPVPEKA